VTVRGNRADAGAFQVAGQYLLACDGGKSTIREALRIPFDGAPDTRTFLMGDFEDTTGWGNQARFFFTARGSVESFPLPDGMRRYVVRTPFFIKEYTSGYLKAELLWRAGVNVADVCQVWESGFGVQRFMARTFCTGPVFLCGDAAHLMSAVGGQNMNIGFADAELAAWLVRLLIEKRAPGHRVSRLYTRARQRAVRAAFRRAHGMMLAGTSGGHVWSAIRNSAAFMALHSPIRQLLIRLFSMQSIPCRNLRNHQDRFEKELKL
jgi:2-polyprenyl-6-methoxyphenol hydroxylase-like FAD-dependent oxidoreductase